MDRTPAADETGLWRRHVRYGSRSSSGLRPRIQSVFKVHDEASPANWHNEQYFETPVAVSRVDEGLVVEFAEGGRLEIFTRDWMWIEPERH